MHLFRIFNIGTSKIIVNNITNILYIKVYILITIYKDYDLKTKMNNYNL